MFVYQNVNPAEQFCPVYYEIKTWMKDNLHYNLVVF